MSTTLEALHATESDLMGRAFLYEHPASFQEGVEASMEAVRAMLARALAQPRAARVRVPAVEGGYG